MAPHRLRKVLCLTSSLVPLAFNQVLANPADGNVAAGAASIAGEGTANLHVHQTTDKAIIDWRSFDIAPGETTRFVQPGTDSVTLNRVTGGLGASAIDGTLKANGKVFLVNPDGIAFGMGAIVDTAGLVATTSNIANDDFMAGNYAFTRPGRADASVVNLGTITATNSGFAALVAPGVRNAGFIVADLGQVALASGNGFTLDFYGDQLITLTVGDEIAAEVKDVATGETLDALVNNEGALRADGGTVYLSAATARKVVDSVINNTGVVEANSIGFRNGKIVLGAGTASTKTTDAPRQKVKVSGTLSASGKASGETGGKIQVTGEVVELAAVTLDASGSVGGGTVLIGGDLGGRDLNPDLVNHAKAEAEKRDVEAATTTSVDAASSINASAIDQGSGGKAVIWADESTSFEGSVAVRGGAASGDGGFVEVSGKEKLRYGGRADLAAPGGADGTLLLDPQSITIGSIGAWVVTPAAINAALATGNVLVFTNAGIPGTGDITISQSLDWSSVNTLTLAAYRNIVFSNEVTLRNTGAGTLQLAAGVSYNGSGSWTPIGAGTIQFLGSGSVDFGSSSGNVYFAYNPASYASPTNFVPFVTTNGSVADQFTAFMWINNAADLTNVSQNLAGNYLVANIDASSLNGFSPIGDLNNPFTGRFIGLNPALLGGLGGTISNLTIDSTASHVGLFGVVGDQALIQHIALENVSATASAPYALVGGLAGHNYGTILNSSTSGPVEGLGTSVAGGLVGWNSGTIGFSSSSASVAGGREENGINAGSSVGGLIGFNQGLVGQSFALGTVSANEPKGVAIGGLVGSNLGIIHQTYARGAVTSHAEDDQPNLVGGLAGHNQGLISESYSTGLVAGSGNLTLAGGLLGMNCCASPVVNSYWDTQTSGMATSAAGIGRTTTQLKSALQTGFDNSAWALASNYNLGYPHLVWQTETPPLSPAVLAPTLATALPLWQPDAFAEAEKFQAAVANLLIEPSLPLHGPMRITQHVGDPWSANSSLKHTGTDIAAQKGASVSAVSGGTVYKQGWLGKDKETGEDWGYYVVLLNPDGTAEAYLHLNKTRFVDGETKLNPGDEIGTIFEDHLHFNACVSPVGCQRGAVTPEEFEKGNFKPPPFPIS